MNKDIKLLIDEWYGNCADIKELTILHKDICMEIDKQLDFMIALLTDREEYNDK